MLVIEERHYTPQVLMGMHRKLRATTLQMARVNPATGKFTTFHWTTAHIDFVTQTIHATAFIDEADADGTVRRYVRQNKGAIPTHYFGRFELELLIEQAGFIVTGLYGGNKREPLGAHSYSMVFVARKNDQAR